MKRFWMAALVGALGLALAGCGGEAAPAGDAEEAPVEKAAESSEDAIQIDEIEWSVGEKAINGTRYITFSYTNNSDYQLLGVDMEFTQREDVTDEQRAAFDELYEENDMWEDFNGGRDEVYISASNTKLIEMGESVDVICFFNHTGMRVNTMEQYELMEPSLMSIAYVVDGKINIEYYDFLNDDYSLDSQSGAAADSWEDDGITKGVPKPESQVITETYRSEDSYSANVFGYTRDDFDAYVGACVKAGFTEEPDEGTSSYSACDPEGRELDLFYDSDDEIMRFSIEYSNGD